MNAKPDVVAQVLHILNTRPADHWTVHALATAVARNRSYVSRRFKSCTGVTIRAYVSARRISFAEELILRGEKIEVASLLAGFRSRRAFNEMFKRAKGITPSEFRRAQSLSSSSQGPYDASVDAVFTPK